MKGIYQKRNFEPTVDVRKYKPVFTTIDNVVHEGYVYNWIILQRVTDALDYLMCDVKADGYLRDTQNIIYPLSAILSIKFEVVDERRVQDTFGSSQVCVRELK